MYSLWCTHYDVLYAIGWVIERWQYHVIVSGLCQCTATRHIGKQPQQSAGGTQLDGQSGVSSPTFRQCYWVTSAAPLVASSPTYRLQAGSHHIQDTIYWHSGLPISPHPRLFTNSHITIVRQIVTFSTSDAASIVSESLQCRLLQSGTHCHITVDRGVWLTKNDFGSVLKKNGFRFGFGFTKLTAVSVFGSVFYTVCCLMCMTLEMMYFRLPCWISPANCQPKWLGIKVQRYGMKKNTLTVDPIMLQDELWMRQCEKPSPNRRSWFFENRTAVSGFWILMVGSVRFLENRYPKFSLDFAYP